MAPKTYEVKFRPLAETDLVRLYDYIADAVGTDVAGAYLEQLEAACRSLATFPERGARRDDIRPGLRLIGFERRATIVFQTGQAEVVIVRMFYGGRGYERALRRDPDD